MKKVIILLTALVLTISVSAQRETSFQKYGDLVVAKTVQSGITAYGLLSGDNVILQAKYRFVYDEELRLIIMMNTEDLYVFGIFDSKPVFEYHFQERQQGLPELHYAYGELQGYPYCEIIFKTSKQEINAGAFLLKEGHTYLVEFRKLY